MSSTRILVAISASDWAYTSSLLMPEFDIVRCHTLADALANLNQDIGLIACGVHFDQGSTFDFLRAAKSQPATRSIPFFLFLKEGTRHSPAITNGIRSAALLLGADQFINLAELKAETGEKGMRDALAKMARQALLARRAQAEME